MHIFISWSGSRSHAVAVALRDWLPVVIQQVTPFVSSEDLPKGSQWLVELSAQLAVTHEGIVCVTPENQGSPWLNYETGALAKATEQTSVRTVLLDLAPTEVEHPLAGFQHTTLADGEDVWKMVRSVNRRCSAPISEEVLRRTFDREWPDLQAELGRAKTLPAIEPALKPTTRDQDAVVRETLDLVRAMGRDVAQIVGTLTPGLASNSVEMPDGPGTRALAVRSEPQKVLFASRLVVGTVIEHDTFGRGPIINRRGTAEKTQIEVDFDTVGKKWLVARFSPVVILDELDD